MQYLVKKPAILNNAVRNPGEIVELEQEWMPSEETLAMLLDEGWIVEATKQDLAAAQPEVAEPAPVPAAAEGGEAPLAEAGQEQPAASEATSSEQSPAESADAPKSVAKTLKVDIKK